MQKAMLSVSLLGLLAGAAIAGNIPAHASNSAEVSLVRAQSLAKTGRACTNGYMTSFRSFDHVISYAEMRTRRTAEVADMQRALAGRGMNYQVRYQGTQVWGWQSGRGGMFMTSQFGDNGVRTIGCKY